MKKYKLTKTFTFDGKRYFVYADTQRDLIIKMADKLKTLESGKITVNSNMTFRAWYEIYISTYKTGCKDITLKNWKYKMEKQVLAEIGSYPIKSIKPLHCQNIAKNLEGYSNDYIKKIKQGMFAIFDKAVENKLILDNPARYMVMPKGSKSTRRAITAKEREYVLEAIKIDERFVFYEIMLYCGLRPSEVAELKGSDIKKGMIKVRGTKSDNAERSVPLPEDLFNKLNAKNFEYIFTNKRGKKLDESGRQHLWHTFKRQLNIVAGCKVYRNKLIPPYPIADDLVPYCLRHTYCTDLCKAGVDVRVAQKLMGHASITTTINIYTHVENSQLVDAQKKLEKYRDNLQQGTTLGTTSIKTI